MPNKKKGSSNSSQGSKTGMQMSRPRRGNNDTITRFNMFPINRLVLEWSASGNTTPDVVTVRNLRLAKVFYGTATGPLFYGMWDTIRVDLVQIVALHLTNIFSDLTFEETGTRAPGKIIKETGTPFSLAQINWKPSENSDLFKFQTANEDANNAFTITSVTNVGGANAACPLRIKIHLSYTDTNAQITTVAGTAAAGNVGTPLFNYLNNSNFWVPSGSPAVTSACS